MGPLYLGASDFTMYPQFQSQIVSHQAFERRIIGLFQAQIMPEGAIWTNPPKGHSGFFNDESFLALQVIVLPHASGLVRSKIRLVLKMLGNCRPLLSERGGRGQAGGLC